MNCIFCKILQRNLPASVVFESASILAFLDIHPVNVGHILIVPRRHVESFTDLTTEEVRQIFETGQYISSLMKKSISGCGGVNLSLADGKVAGQEVSHVHLHIIPRFPEDGFGWKFPAHYSEDAVAREDLDKVAKLIKDAIDSAC